MERSCWIFSCILFSHFIPLGLVTVLHFHRVATSGAFSTYIGMFSCTYVDVCMYRYIVKCSTNPFNYICIAISSAVFSCLLIFFSSTLIQSSTFFLRLLYFLFLFFHVSVSDFVALSSLVPPGFLPTLVTSFVYCVSIKIIIYLVLL